jgi:phosphotransferase system IIA component
MNTPIEISADDKQFLAGVINQGFVIMPKPRGKVMTPYHRKYASLKRLIAAGFLARETNAEAMVHPTAEGRAIFGK